MPATTTTTNAATTNMTAGRTDRATKRSTPPSSGGAVYGLGMIGALVYFVGTSQSGWDYVLAVGKAVVWPALLVYEAFRTLDR